MMKILLSLIILTANIISPAAITPATAQENRLSIRGSNLEIPRFASLKTNLVNMRVGPSRDYPILWQYRRKGLPIKIIGEFDVWRKVIDHEGTTGWMHVSTLSVKRTAIITASTVKMHRSASEMASVRAVIEANVIAFINSCREDWCKITTQRSIGKNTTGKKVTGWVQKNALWGIFENENYQ